MEPAVAEPEAEAAEPDDGIETMPEDAPARPKARLTLTDKEIAERLRKDPASLGSMSVGLASAGALFNGVQMPRSNKWELLDPGNAWGTKETVEMLARAIERVHERFPGSPTLPIGHLSARRGGALSPHKSHQSGRDVDIGYFHLDGARHQFIRAGADNLDLERTWAFVKVLVKETDVEMILVDTSLQKLLAAHALAKGEDPAFVDAVFQSRGKSPNPFVRYAPGHLNHLHIRFLNPIAQELGKHAHPALAKTGAAPATTYVLHKARSGDVLVHLANHYGTTIEAIQQANGLKGTALQIGAVYKIPSKAPAKPTAAAAPAPRPQQRKANARGPRG